MPYGGADKKQNAKIEKCVSSPKWDGKINKRTGKPYSKSEKIAICKAQVLKQSLVEVDKELWLVEKKKKVKSSEPICQQYEPLAVTSEMIEKVVDDEDELFDSVSESAKLTYERREGLPDSAFCLVYMEKGKSGKMLKRRRFPAHDKAHVKNGLQQLPKANLTPAQTSKVRGCLIRRAKKYGIKVGSSEMPLDDHIYSFSPVQSLQEMDFESMGLNDEEMTLIQSAISIEPDEEGYYTVFAGMGGQNGFNMWGEKFVYSDEFFQSTFKLFEKTFYYPGHYYKFEVEKRSARVMKSYILEIGEKKITAMFHKIKPKNAAIESEIQNEFLSDVSIDVFSPIMSEDDDHLIVDGTPYGTAFVAGLANMKGCPVCKTVHTVGSSCLTSECPTGTPEMSEQEIKDQEVESNMAKDKEKEKPSGEEDTEPEKKDGIKSGVPDEDEELYKSKVDALESEMNKLRFGTEVASLAKRASVDESVVMSAVTDATPQERMKSLEIIIKASEETMKKIMSKKVIEYPKLAATGSGGEDEGDEITKSQINKTLAELRGQIYVPPTEAGDAE